MAFPSLDAATLLSGLGKASVSGSLELFFEACRVPREDSSSLLSRGYGSGRQPCELSGAEELGCVSAR